MSFPSPTHLTLAAGIRFVLFGAVNTALTYLIYCLLVFVLHPQIAFAVAFVIGIVLAYIGNSRYVFRQALTWKIARTYPLVYLLQYALSAMLLHLFGLWLDLGPRLALALTLVFTTPISFFLNRAILNPMQRGDSLHR